MTLHSRDFTRIKSRLERIYDSDPESATKVDVAFQLIVKSMADHESHAPPGDASSARWDESDVVLITYGDQVSHRRSDSDSPNSGSTSSPSPMATLLRFLSEHGLFNGLNTVHFLPCFPYTSDDGFSVVDYRRIDPNLGSWDDVAAFRQRGHLMFDFVVNHISQESEWFQKYLAGESPYADFFIEADPTMDLSAVTRPRSLPLLSDFETSRGARWLWTTFSRDQVDLNYESPRLLAEVVDILLLYVRQGARIIRLDAIAYLWKQIGTNCIHLPQTHEVVKLFRDVFDMVAPHALLLTETNVPHDENVSYFGNGDEAHMVYQFSLPPLLLDGFLNNDATPLKCWLASLESPPAGSTFFNFTASHDGIGVRPLEGQVSDERLFKLVEEVRLRGAHVGTRRNPDGSDSPYELNVSYVDALGPADNELTVDQHAERFLASQAIMMSLQGVPAVYFHSLVGTQNDQDAVAATGIPRRINRRKFTIDELNDRLGSETLHSKIFTGMKALLALRIQQPAFHPDASQTYIESGSDRVLCFERCSTDTSTAEKHQRLLVAANFSDQTEQMALPDDYALCVDRLSSDETLSSGKVQLDPWQVVWLEPRN